VCSIPWEFRTLAFLIAQLANFTDQSQMIGKFIKQWTKKQEQ